MAVLGAAAGGGGAISNFPITFAASTTWACPAVMEAYIFVIGGGGSGSAAAYKADGRCQGGTAGGCAVSKVTLAAQDYVIVIGPGGNPTAALHSGAVVAGAVGSPSTFTDAAASLIATMTGGGGLGGTAHATDDLSAVAGGTASGGTIMNNAGGGVPAVTVDESITSGGAVGLWEAGRIGETSYGANIARESLPQGNDGQGLTGSPGGNWGSESSWFIPPLNVSMTLAVTSNTSGGRDREYVPAGAKSVGQSAYSVSTTNLYWLYPSPLSGGTGGTGNYTYVSVGGATLGAGGGGVLSRRATSSVMSGAGGHGGVIIIPISLGS